MAVFPDSRRGGWPWLVLGRMVEGSLGWREVFWCSLSLSCPAVTQVTPTDLLESAIVELARGKVLVGSLIVSATMLGRPKVLRPKMKPSLRQTVRGRKLWRSETGRPKRWFRAWCRRRAGCGAGDGT